MYAYQNDILSIPASVLYDTWKVISYDNYKQKCCRKKIIKTKDGRGKDNEAWISFYDLPLSWQERAISEFGDPQDKSVIFLNKLEKYIQPDPVARKFFKEHRKPNGKALDYRKQREKVCNATILNAIKYLFNSGEINKVSRWNKKNIWPNFSEAVNTLSPEKFSYSLPGNPRSLKRKYLDYIDRGYAALLHRGEGVSNRQKITGDISEYIIAMYALPIKYTIPELLQFYNDIRESRNWPVLTHQAIYKYLEKPENKRIWSLGRHGKEVYNRKFKHTLTRDRSNWYSNAYVAIDGTKLDWVHKWESSSNKMGAAMRVNVAFDIFSEKILGYSKSFSEDHSDHFKAVKMAVMTAGTGFKLFTYDNQSGHKMARMQRFYDRIVSDKKGVHHPHRAYEHNSPVEQLFNRIQQQVIKKVWFADGQSITVKKDDNKPNIDFIKENKLKLHTPEDLDIAWKMVVEKWNNMEHPHFKGKTRDEVYEENRKTDEAPLSLLDIVNNMYVEEIRRPITYRAQGLDIRIGNKKYQFEVYDNEGNIDIEFRRLNVGRKFIVRYDPELLDTGVQLCTMDDDAEIVYVATAQTKHTFEVIPALMRDGEKAAWAKDYKVRELELARDEAALKALQERTGITTAAMIEEQELALKLQATAPKKERNKTEQSESICALERL